jgi:hypothetical protein
MSDPAISFSRQIVHLFCCHFFPTTTKQSGTNLGFGHSCQISQSGDREKRGMKRLGLIGLALLAMTVSASARLAMAPLSAPDAATIEVKGGRGHGRGHGHMGRGGRGHHYGWYRGRGHHKGWRHHRHYRRW